MNTVLDCIHPKWKPFVKSKKSELVNALTEIQDQDITPPFHLIFASLRFNPMDTKVVIIGQDPYPNRGDACGLAFSSHAKETPASLRNIFKCLNRLGYTTTSNDLSPWTHQGVLLLNVSLTTIVDQSKSHTQLWKPITASIISTLTKMKENIHFLLWGNDAQSMKKYIKGTQHIHEWKHPSPMGDGANFVNCNNFDNLDFIDWSTGNPLYIYTDGAKGKYGVHIPTLLDCSGIVADAEYQYQYNCEITTKDNVEIPATTQRGEYLAMCYALYFVYQMDLRNVHIITDSANVQGILTEWTKKSTEKFKNPDLVNIFRTLYEKVKHQCKIIHTFSHNKDKNSPYNKGNDVADKLAANATKPFQLIYKDVRLS